jgi:hypothetical protein
MADERYKTVSMFALPDEYQRQASEARRRRRMAEMLAQQAYQPGDIQNAPIPRGAPLVQGLQAFLAARGERKAEEAEESAMKAQTREARDFLRALTEPAKTMTIGEAAMQDIAQAGTPELVDGRLEYRKTAMPAPTPEMVPQAGPQVRLGRRPEDDQVYMPTATGRETDPQRMAAMLANPQYKAEFTPEQKRALALEGVLTSQNPLVQKIGQMQYGAMQPSQIDVGAVNLSDLTPDSARKFARSRNPNDIEYRASEVKPEAVSSLGRMIAERKAIFDKDPTDPRIADYDRAIKKETNIPGPSVVTYGTPMPAVDAQGNPVFIQPSRSGGAPSVLPGYTPPSGKETPPTVSEATSGWNVGRIVNAANAIQRAIEKDPSAIKPSVQEFAAGMVSDEAANAARSPQRQIVVGEQSDLLDAYLTLATGAAYTDPQFINAKRGLTPTLTDDAAAIERKSKKLLELIPQAKERTGAAWTPELEKAVRDLAASFNKSAPPSTVNPAKGWGKAQQVR